MTTKITTRDEFVAEARAILDGAAKPDVEVPGPVDATNNVLANPIGDAYAARVAAIEAEGATTSDAQGAADVEFHERGECDRATCSLPGHRKAAKAKPTKPAPSKAPSVAKADPARVAAYLATTGLDRKEIAAVLGKSVGLIAHVTRATGDRWSVDRLREAIATIEKHLKAKKVERPIDEPMTPDALTVFIIPEGEAAPASKAKPARKAASK